ncbi:MAG: methyltransferase domain-containing protein [Nocardioides sp.]
MTDDAMVAEFDDVAAWTAEAVAELGADHALPAACRGSGSPAALVWLMDGLELRYGTRLLDSGAGVGGPAELAARQRGVAPTLVEPMEGACRAAVQLFGRPVVVADGAALPFPTGAFDAAWSLGVLCTVQDKERHLAEIARVVQPGGRVGLLVFVRLVEDLGDQPDGNHFPTLPELHAAIGRTGLQVIDEARIGDFATPPEAWEHAASEVGAVIERDHGAKESWRVSEEQQQLMVRLISDGHVVGHLVVSGS